MAEVKYVVQVSGAGLVGLPSTVWPTLCTIGRTTYEQQNIPGETERYLLTANRQKIKAFYRGRQKRQRESGHSDLGSQIRKAPVCY